MTQLRAGLGMSSKKCLSEQTVNSENVTTDLWKRKDHSSLKRIPIRRTIYKILHEKRLLQMLVHHQGGRKEKKKFFLELGHRAVAKEAGQHEGGSPKRAT